SGCERQNSPMDGSRVKPLTPFPVVYTSIVEEPYMTYPAAICSVPLCNISWEVGSPEVLFLRYIEKIVPTETLTSMFEEPSSGSMATMYLAFLETAESM